MCKATTNSSEKATGDGGEEEVQSNVVARLEPGVEVLQAEGEGRGKRSEDGGVFWMEQGIYDPGEEVEAPAYGAGKYSYDICCCQSPVMHGMGSSVPASSSPDVLFGKLSGSGIFMLLAMVIKTTQLRTCIVSQASFDPKLRGWKSPR